MLIPPQGTIICGADKNRMQVVSIVYKVRPSRQNLSITMAANFQSEITSSSSSLSFSLLVIYLSSFRICLTSLEMSWARFLLELQQQWWTWLEQPPGKGSSSGGTGKDRTNPPPFRDIGLEYWSIRFATHQSSKLHRNHLEPTKHLLSCFNLKKI